MGSHFLNQVSAIPIFFSPKLLVLQLKTWGINASGVCLPTQFCTLCKNEQTIKTKERIREAEMPDSKTDMVTEHKKLLAVLALNMAESWGGLFS